MSRKTEAEIKKRITDGLENVHNVEILNLIDSIVCESIKQETKKKQ